MHHFKKLVVWERSVAVALEVYRLSRTFPKEEKFGITAQMRRCAVSIGSNIAEACGRAHDDGFKHFMHVAYSSCLELETQLIIAYKLGYLENPDFHAIEGQLHEIQKMLYSLIKKQRYQKPDPSPRSLLPNLIDPSIPESHKLQASGSSHPKPNIGISPFRCPKNIDKTITYQVYQTRTGGM